MKVNCTAARGYFLSIPSDLYSIPSHYVQAVLQKKTISCSTVELNSLSDRSIESITQALTITKEIIQSVLDKIRLATNQLFCFADNIVSLYNYVV